MVTFDHSHFTDHGSMLVARSIWASIFDSKPMLDNVAGAFADFVAQATTGARAESRLPVLPCRQAQRAIPLGRQLARCGS